MINSKQVKSVLGNSNLEEDIEYLVNNAGTGGGGGGLKYKELDFTFELSPNESISISEDINTDALLITTMYFEAGYYFNFKIFDSISSDKFNLYELRREKCYSDSIFLLYSDKENLGKLNLNIQNEEPYNNKIKVKILGLEVSK